VHARLVDEDGPKLTPDDEMDDKVAHSLDPFLSRLSRSDVKPPSFVPAFRTYDEYGLPIRAPGGMDTGGVSASEGNAKPRDDVAGWYKNLRRTNEVAVLESGRPEDAQVLTRQPSASTNAPPKPQPTQSINRKRKRGWFDSSVASIPLASASHPPTPVPTMVDMITRAPSPSQQGASLSVSRNFSVIPPSNKGFSILSKSLGWQEGEGLGRSAKRRHTKWSVVMKGDASPGSPARSATKLEDTESESEDGKEGPEDGDESSGGEEDDIPVQLQDTQQDSNDSLSITVAGHLNDHQTACLQSNPASSIHPAPRIAPIPVALKHDRLGVGASKKRIILTSNTLARFASNSERRNLSDGAIRHIETKARHRKRREKFGRGRNSYARMEKQEAKDRGRMLEYMNT
jgi:G-patch domain